MVRTIDILKEQLEIAGVGKNQNLFSVIDIGGIVISATSPEDTLELAPGTNVTLNADSVTKTITIGATGGGGVGIRVLFDDVVDYITPGVQVSGPGSWFSKASMPTARDALTSSVINNILYAVGGDNGSYLSINEAYDPTTNSWTSKASMPTARHHLASSVINNILYVVGGINGSSYLSTNEAYDPATNSWTTKATMPTARYYLASSVINNILYVVGGYGSSMFSTNEAYDPATNSWTTKAAMPTARYALTSSVINNILYVVGGYNGSFLSTNEAYQPEYNLFLFSGAGPAVVTAAKMDIGELFVDTGAGSTKTLTSSDLDVPVPCVNASAEYRWDGSQQRVVVIG